MKSASSPNILIILDDREYAADEVSGLVGNRRFGDIIFKRRRLSEHLKSTLPPWARAKLMHVRSAQDLAAVRGYIEAGSEEMSACIIAGRAGFTDGQRLHQLIERLPYAEEDFTDRLYKPLFVFLHNAHDLISRWPALEGGPVHTWEQAWQDCPRLESVLPLDLGRIRDFLSFTTGATATRYFNAVQIDSYYYTKSSTDKRKMRAEYSFYEAVPESMRPWLIQPFDFQENGDRASYKMMRYYLADAALQWVHDAFDAESFSAFVDRLLFFIAQRPRQACTRAASAAVARDLFVDKVQARARQFLQMEEGQRIDRLVASATPALGLEQQLKRYLALYARHEKQFAFEHAVAGHGDPCFSNILYDQQRYLMKFIDPKGAMTPQEVWTHPLYDLCKVSHSVLGDYDFINNGLYRVGFTEGNDLELHIDHGRQPQLKPDFKRRVKALGHDVKIMRLGEASLFLSMLPLHIDHPNKVIAFLLTAHSILDEVEND